ncbi:MAG: ABC transporter ATP-binding protein, partial [Planctomycetota bacterium]
EIDELLVSTKDSEELNKLLHEQDELMHRFETLGGYTMEANLEKVLIGVGFSVKDFEKKVPNLSGGEKRRLAFASLLLSHPDVLLLDEPTNHLDIEAIQWTEDFLAGYNGAIVVVSHDRMFLDKVCNKTIEILGKKLHHYSGNYTFYEQEREVRYQLALRSYEAQQEEIARQEEIIRRVHANPKLNVAQSRRRQLEKIERLEKPVPPPKGAHFRFRNINPKGNLAIEGKNLTHGYGNRILFKGINLRIEPGERVAFVGPNGAGKSTLMKIFAREIQPMEGEVIYGKTTTFGYFSQERTDLPLERTVLQVMQDAYPKEDKSNLQSFLALFLFGEEDLNKEVRKLSGGERSKLSLARILYSEPNLLALDEPTNHLDIPTCKNLEEALLHFPGTLLFVSHDRYFINRLARKIIYIKDGKVKEIYGNYMDLEEKLREEKKQTLEKSKQKKGNKQKSKKKGTGKKRVLPSHSKQKKKKYKGSLQQLEAEIMALEEKLDELNQEMSRPEIYQKGSEISRLRKEYDHIQNKLKELNEYWEEMVESS